MVIILMITYLLKNWRKININETTKWIFESLCFSSFFHIFLNIFRSTHFHCDKRHWLKIWTLNCYSLIVPWAEFKSKINFPGVESSMLKPTEGLFFSIAAKYHSKMCALKNIETWKKKTCYHKTDQDVSWGGITICTARLGIKIGIYLSPALHIYIFIFSFFLLFFFELNIFLPDIAIPSMRAQLDLDPFNVIVILSNLF